MRDESHGKGKGQRAGEERREAPFLKQCLPHFVNGGRRFIEREQRQERERHFQKGRQRPSPLPSPAPPAVGRWHAFYRSEANSQREEGRPGSRVPVPTPTHAQPALFPVPKKGMSICRREERHGME